MKRILSLLVVLAMVIAMIPSVFAAKTEIDMDELLGILTELESIDEIEVTLAEGAAKKVYKWTPEKNGILSLQVELPEGAQMDITMSQGENSITYSELDETTPFELAVVAGEGVTIVVTKSSEPAVEATLTGTFLAENNTEAEAILVDFVWNEEHTEATATVTAEPGVTYYGQYRIGGMELTVNDGEAFIVEDKGMMYPSTFTIVNEGEEAAEYTLKLCYPTGSRMNPEVLEELNYYYGELALAEGNGEGYYYSYTAPADGSIQLYFVNITEGVTGDIVVNNLKTYAQKTLLADGVDNYGLELTVEVSEGDELIIQVLAVPGADWSVPAADVTWFGNFTYPVGTEQNPVQPEWQWNETYTEATATVSVPAGETVYVSGNNGMYLSIDGGEATLMQSEGAGFFAPPPVFTLTNDGEAAKDFALKIWYPEGTMMNPAQLVIGENTAEIGAGSDGYFYSWIAEANGNLTITMPEGNWSYTLNNITSGAYGDMQWSNEEPVNPATISVKEGDEIQLIINTFDPENPWNTPAGTLTVTAAFEEVTYIVGDIDGNGSVDVDDAIYLLQHVLMPDLFAVSQPIDVNNSGAADVDDAIYLLQYVLMPDLFPLFPTVAQ